jgi:hypothetical protein
MTRVRASSRRAAIAVSAASAAAPTTLPLMRIALRMASPLAAPGRAGPSPNHTVTAVCSVRSPWRWERARSTRTAAGVSG